MTALSILELVRMTTETDARAALDNARDLAAWGERWGYTRFWVSEHHNMTSIASAATALVLSHVAAGSSTIRIGAGGIMLPNHAPLIIAEQFGTLARLYPGRIDLGLGRASGSDQATTRALRTSSADRFPQDILELQSYFTAKAAERPVQAIPAAGTNVPLWILGSSTYGAHLAADLGLPYAFASHFAPDLLAPALDIYRSRFKPSAQLSQPYVTLSVNVVAAETDEEARWLATTQQMSFADMLRGVRILNQPPIKDIDTYWTARERAQVMNMLSRTIVGGPETVRRGLADLALETRADELMIVSDIFDHARRLRSYEITSMVAASR